MTADGVISSRPRDGRAQVAWRAIHGVVIRGPAIVLILCSVSADLVAVFGGDPLGIWQVLPAGPVAGDWLSAELSSVAFLLIGIALLRRKRAGFWLGLAVAGGALVVQGASLDHPVSGVAAGVLAVALLATRDEYDVGTSRRVAILASGLVVACGILVAGAAALIPSGTDVVGTATDAVGALFDLATPIAVPGITAAGAALVLARIVYLVATILVLDPVEDERSPETVASARVALRRLGAGSLFPYQLEPQCVPFSDEAGSAVISVAGVGRAAVVLGDPAGAPDAGHELLREWARRCDRRDLVPVVYQASAEAVERLRAGGWHAVHVGREAVVDPIAFDLRTPALANLRHTVTRSRRGGVRVVWSSSGVDGLGDPRIAAGMADLDAAWRHGAGPRLGFTVGRFDPQDQRECAIAVAIDEDRELEAFVVLRPTGADGGWMLDLMRRRRDGVPGAVEACLVTAIEELATLGVRNLSLGLAPLAGLDIRTGPLAERALAGGARLIRPLYDHEGLAFFKGKFGPTWEPRYLVLRHWWDLPAAAFALLRLHLGGSWPRVLTSVLAGLAPAR